MTPNTALDPAFAGSAGYFLSVTYPECPIDIVKLVPYSNCNRWRKRHGRTEEPGGMSDGSAAAPAHGAVDDLYPLGPAQQWPDPIRRTAPPGRRGLRQGSDRTPAHAGRGRR